MYSIGKAKGNFYIVIVTATLNLGLNFLFIEEWGVIGAAYATLLSSILSFIIAQSILGRRLGVNLLHTFIYAYRFYPEMYLKFVKKKA